MLFKSLDCPECKFMYNNKDRRPQIICANNHLLCRSCYSMYFNKRSEDPSVYSAVSILPCAYFSQVWLFPREYPVVFEDLQPDIRPAAFDIV